MRPHLAQFILRITGTGTGTGTIGTERYQSL